MGISKRDDTIKHFLLVCDGVLNMPVARLKKLLPSRSRVTRMHDEPLTDGLYAETKQSGCYHPCPGMTHFHGRTRATDQDKNIPVQSEAMYI